uniref:Uncharacterized protein n=1 Tax=Mycena chlorophos TaxID=658473 RepID=A0ABQ0LBM0_MYCCL|nr:predicted protein [Mycena chlorophos]
MSFQTHAYPGPVFNKIISEKTVLSTETYGDNGKKQKLPTSSAEYQVVQSWWFRHINWTDVFRRFVPISADWNVTTKQWDCVEVASKIDWLAIAQAPALGQQDFQNAVIVVAKTGAWVRTVPLVFIDSKPDVVFDGPSATFTFRISCGGNKIYTLHYTTVLTADPPPPPFYFLDQTTGHIRVDFAPRTSTPQLVGAMELFLNQEYFPTESSTSETERVLVGRCEDGMSIDDINLLALDTFRWAEIAAIWLSVLNSWQKLISAPWTVR